MSIASSIFTGNTSLTITDLIGGVISPNKCLVTIDDINTSLRVYKAELINIKEDLKKVDFAMNKLAQFGWSGEASQAFYSSKFIMIKSSMGKIESQLSYMVRYLEKAKKSFESIKLEEDALVGILA